MALFLRQFELSKMLLLASKHWPVGLLPNVDISCFSPLILCCGKHVFYAAAVFSTSEFQSFMTLVQLSLLVAVVQSVSGQCQALDK